jgi:hypothetical protein
MSLNGEYIPQSICFPFPDCGVLATLISLSPLGTNRLMIIESFIRCEKCGTAVGYL